jgi:modulator of FtsH protease
MPQVLSTEVGFSSESRVIRDTYALLSATLLVTAGFTWVSMGLDLSSLAALGCLIGGFVMLFVISRMRNSAWGLAALFGFATLEGLGIGPTITMYMRTPAGSATVAEASLLTAGVFLSLSAYVHVTKKDFSAWGGMLFTGLIVVVLASLIGIFVSSSAYHLTIAAISAILFSGFILFDTSRIVRGGETNYIMASLSLYLDIINLFFSLLQLLSAGNDRR